MGINEVIGLLETQDEAHPKTTQGFQLGRATIVSIKDMEHSKAKQCAD
jgi:hypothetical protein